MNDSLIIEIETAIRKVSWATAQVGQKSLQRITVAFDKRRTSNDFLTGTTKICLLELGSVRDNFKVTRPRFNGSGVAFFTASGETASGVRIMPNINYSFEFEVSRSEVKFSGAHDGYPSYNISINGQSAYDYIQGYLWQLAGASDVTVMPRTFAVSA